MGGRAGGAQDVDLEDLFSLRRPKNVLSGASSGLQSVAKGARTLAPLFAATAAALWGCKRVGHRHRRELLAADAAAGQAVNDTRRQAALGRLRLCFPPTHDRVLAPLRRRHRRRDGAHSGTSTRRARGGRHRLPERPRRRRAHVPRPHRMRVAVALGGASR
jgi:hypothetical protein